MENKERFHSLLNFFVKGSLILLITTFLSKGITYVYRIVVARNLGVEGYGLFSIVTLISVIFVSFFSLGLGEGVLRYISFYNGENKQNKIKSLLAFSLIISIFTGILAGICLFLLSDLLAITIFHNPELSFLLKLSSFFIPISIFAGVFRGVLKAYEKVKEYTIIENILFPLFQLGFLFVFLLMGMKNSSIVLSYYMGSVIVLLASVLVLKNKIKFIFNKKNLPSKERNEINRGMFSYSWPIMFFGVITILFSCIDSFMIGFFLNTEQVGIYNVAVPLSYLLLLIPPLFLQFFMPIVTKEYSRNNTPLIKELTQKISKWIFTICLPLFLVMVLVPETIIEIFFGEEYLQATNSLRFLSIGIFFYCLSLISENILLMVGRSKALLKNIIFASVINLILNLILIPPYGIEGAAFSTMISYLILGSLSIITSIRHYPVKFLPNSFFKILLISLFSASPLYFSRPLLLGNPVLIFLLGFLFLVLYFFLLLIFSCFDQDDLKIIKSIKDRVTNKN